MPEEKENIIDEVLLQENRNLQILQKSLSGALKDVFGEYTESQRFLDLKRIPLICKDISNINKNLEDIKSSIDTKDKDFEQRLRLVENRQMWWAGASIVVGTIGGYLLQHIIK